MRTIQSASEKSFRATPSAALAILATMHAALGPIAVIVGLRLTFRVLGTVIVGLRLLVTVSVGLRLTVRQWKWRRPWHHLTCRGIHEQFGY